MTSLPEIPGFELVEQIGSGGFSRVYRAVQGEFGREVALKVLRIDGRDDEVRFAFERECALAGRLTGHPYVLTVLGSGFVPADSEPYLVLEYCPGGTLSKRLADDGPLMVHDALSLGISLAGALQSAHRHGIIHRDVKPQNVLFNRSGVPVLADFGVAKLRTAESLQVTSSGLTPLHAAPEVLRHEPASPASDLYSLGSTLYTALSGRAPFGSSEDAPFAVMLRAVNEPVPPLDRRDVSEDLENLLLAVMAKDPRDRPTVPEFAGELRRCAQRRSTSVPDFVVLEPPVDFDPDITTDPIPGADLTPSPAAMSLQRTRRRRQTHRSMVAGAVVMVLILAVAVTWVFARNQSGDSAAAANGASSTTSSSSSSTTAPQPPSSLLDGIQTSLPISYPYVPNLRTDYQDRAASVEPLVSLLGLPAAPKIVDRLAGAPQLTSVPAVFTTASTNPGSGGRCHQMITDPLLLEATGEVTSVTGSPATVVTITITAFHDEGQAIEYFNVVSAYMGISDAECAESPTRSSGLVTAIGSSPISHAEAGVDVPKAVARYSHLNLWKGLRAYRNSDSDLLPTKSGHTGVGLIAKTVIVVSAGSSDERIDLRAFDEILLVAASVARV